MKKGFMGLLMILSVTLIVLNGISVLGQEIVKEQVTCVFAGSKIEQKCYTTNIDAPVFSCSGVQKCSVKVSGEKGKKLTWISSCPSGVSQYTVIDGKSQTIAFPCGGTKTPPVSAQGGQKTPPTTGNLLVTSAPSKADLYVDSVLKGLTPITVKGISVGSHNVLVTKAGYDAYGTTAIINPGKTTKLHVKLIKVETPKYSCKDTLLEYQTRIYTLSGKDYGVTLTFVDADEAQFVVNGQTTPKLKKGATYELSDGTTIGVMDIVYQTFEGGIHSATFFLDDHSGNTCILKGTGATKGASAQAGTSCKEKTPSFTVFPKIQYGKPGETLIYDLKVKNNDKSCEPRSFLITGQAPLVNGEMWEIHFYIYGAKRYPDGERRSNFVLDPQENPTIKMHVTSKEDWPSGRYSQKVFLNYGKPGEDVHLDYNIKREFIYSIKKT